MGFLTKLFGGADLPRLPAQAGQLADTQAGFANDLRGVYTDANKNSQNYRSQIEELLNQSAQNSRPGQNFLDRYKQGGVNQFDRSEPIINQTLSEINNAGSVSRQNREASLAEADFNRSFTSLQDQRSRQLQRQGVRPNSGDGYGSLLQAALGRTAAGNTARDRERQQGEAIRREQLSYLGDSGGRAIERFRGAGDALGQTAERSRTAALTPAYIHNALLGLAGQGAQTAHGAQQGYLSNYDRDYRRAQAQAEYDTNKYNNILKTAVGFGTGGFTGAYEGFGNVLGLGNK